MIHDKSTMNAKNQMDALILDLEAKKLTKMEKRG